MSRKSRKHYRRQANAKPKGLFGKLWAFVGPPMVIGLCVLAVSVLAAGTLAAVIMGDELGDTAADILQNTSWFAGR